MEKNNLVDAGQRLANKDFWSVRIVHCLDFQPIRLTEINRANSESAQNGRKSVKCGLSGSVLAAFLVLTKRKAGCGTRSMGKRREKKRRENALQTLENS